MLCKLYLMIRSLKSSKTAEYVKHSRHMAATNSTALGIRAGRCGGGGDSLGTCLALEGILGKIQRWEEEEERPVERGNVVTDGKSYSVRLSYSLLRKPCIFWMWQSKNVPTREVRTLSEEQDPLLNPETLCVLTPPVYLPPQDTKPNLSMKRPICPGHSSDIYISMVSDHHCSLTSCILWRKRYKIRFSAITSSLLLRNYLEA